MPVLPVSDFRPIGYPKTVIFSAVLKGLIQTEPQRVGALGSHGRWEGYGEDGERRA